MSGRDVYNMQREYQLSYSPFSEEFIIFGTLSTFRGIFDRSFREEAKDKGNVTNRKFLICILCSALPVGLIPRVSKIVRENGDTYTYSYAGLDDEGVSHLWLI